MEYYPVFDFFFSIPSIAKVLLRHGANPDLRDEDGKTPLDKARERNDEGHREVASILQSPADWIPSTQEEQSSSSPDEQPPEKEEEDTKPDPEVVVVPETAAAAAYPEATAADPAEAAATTTTSSSPEEPTEVCQQPDHIPPADAPSNDDLPKGNFTKF